MSFGSEFYENHAKGTDKTRMSEDITNWKNGTNKN